MPGGRRTVTKAEMARRQASLRLAAQQAAAMFEERGDVLSCWNNKRVLGMAIAMGLVSWRRLREAGLDAPVIRDER